MSARLNDLLSILKGLWFPLVLLLITFYAFALSSMGPDVLWCVVEDASVYWLPLIILFIVAFIWSVSSFFCTRLLISMSDNSGKTLSAVRVGERKDMQLWVAYFFMYFPQGVLLFGFWRAFIINRDMLNAWDIVIMIGITIVLCFELYVLKRYFAQPKLVRLRQKIKAFDIGDDLRDRMNKLYPLFGVFREDVPSTIPLPADLSGGKLGEFLRSNGINVPDEVEEAEPNKVHGNLRIFILKFPASFYAPVTRLIKWSAAIAFLLILILAFFPNEWYVIPGTTALLCFGFAAWQFIYLYFHYLDKGVARLRYVPVRLLMLVLAITFSFINDDHPARTMTESKQLQQKDPTAHFKSWYEQVEKTWDSTHNNGVKGTDSIPVIFVAAEGGAFRTGAYTAMMLSLLQDTLKGALEPYIYCYSGVSGGQCGQSYFHAQSQVEKPGKMRADTRKFFLTDILSPIAGKLIFGEVLNVFWPCRIERFDRSVALEKGWEEAWDDINTDHEGMYGAEFSTVLDHSGKALIVNTHEVESGLQCYWSNINLNELPYGKYRNLHTRTDQTIRYSTASHLSSRFPFISPPAMFCCSTDAGEKRRRHFVDGGYYENKGSETLYQLLDYLNLESDTTYRRARIYVVQFNFAQDHSFPDPKEDGNKFMNEVRDILAGIINARSGRTDISAYNMSGFCYRRSPRYRYITFENTMSTTAFPLDWILSTTAMNRLDDYCVHMVDSMLVNKNDTIRNNINFRTMYGHLRR